MPVGRSSDDARTIPIGKEGRAEQLALRAVAYLVPEGAAMEPRDRTADAWRIINRAQDGDGEARSRLQRAARALGLSQRHVRRLVRLAHQEHSEPDHPDLQLNRRLLDYLTTDAAPARRIEDVFRSDRLVRERALDALGRAASFDSKTLTQLLGDVLQDRYAPPPTSASRDVHWSAEEDAEAYPDAVREAMLLITGDGRPPTEWDSSAAWGMEALLAHDDPTRVIAAIVAHVRRYGPDRIRRGIPATLRARWRSEALRAALDTGVKDRRSPGSA